MTDLIFEETRTHVLVRRPASTNDGRYTIGKIRPFRGPWRSGQKVNPVLGFKLSLNGDEEVTQEDLAEIYLVIATMNKSLTRET